jgi:uncharacterized membrane protein (UPF0136 family)
MIHTTIFIIYAVLLFVGAFMGYRAGSKISLIMATFSGIVVSAGILLSDVNPLAGTWLIALMSFVLTVMFAKRLLLTKKFMPSGMLLLASLIVLAVAFKHLV